MKLKVSLEEIVKKYNNGLDANAQLVMPNLARLNELRAELGHKPLEREEVPDNISFAEEMDLDD